MGLAGRAQGQPRMPAIARNSNHCKFEERGQPLLGNQPCLIPEVRSGLEECGGNATIGGILTGLRHKGDLLLPV
jgi:hypothetical protein